MNTLKLFEKVKNQILATLQYQKNKIDKTYRKLFRGQHQLTSTTYANRYPGIFISAKNLSTSIGWKISILSFGCSTGEECFTLSNYFPESRIFGTDINKKNLKKAARRNRFQNIKFVLSDPKVLAKEGKYHIIFCLSVLCRWEETKYVSNCSSIYSFEKFEKTIGLLVNLLENGGYLVIYNSNFRFEDSKFFDRFQIVSTPMITNSGFVYKFDKENNRIFEKHKNVIYRKIL